MINNFSQMAELYSLRNDIKTVDGDVQTIVSSIGQPNGIAPLNANGQIDPSYLDPNVMELKGTSWDASNNTNPTLADGTGNLGDIYIVAVGGTQFTPAITFVAGDTVIYDGAKWKKIPSQNVSTLTNSDGNLIVSGTVNKVINTSTDPSFTTVSATGAITSANQLTTKTYVDTNDGLNLKINQNLNDLNNVSTARTNLQVFDQVETVENNKLSLNRFKLPYTGSPSIANSFTIQTTPTNYIGIGAGSVLSTSSEPTYTSQKIQDISSYLSSITTGVLLVYEIDRYFTNPVRYNKYEITGIKQAPDLQKYMEWNVNVLENNFTPTLGTKYILELQEKQPLTANNVSATDGTHTTILGSNVQTQLDSADTALTNNINALNNIVISDLNDVNTTGVQATDALTYDGVNWTPAPTTSEEDITNSVLFDAPFNTNPNDVSSFATAGTITGTLTQVAGKLGNAYNNTSNGNYISYGHLSRVNFTSKTPFTICYWFKSNDTGTTLKTVVSQGLSTNGNGWYIEQQPANSRVQFRMSDGTSARNLYLRWEFGSGLYDNNWHFVCLVHRAEDGWTQGSTDLFLDGEKRNDVKTTLNDNLLENDDITTDPSTVFSIFSRNLGEGSEFVGDIDNVQIFNFSFFGNYPANSLWNNGTGKQNPDYTIKTILTHDHPISQIRGLQGELDTIDANIIINANNLTTHILSTSAHLASNITTNNAGNFITVNDTQINLNELDAQLLTTNNRSISNLNNIANHIASTSAHPATNITTTGGGNYAIGTTVQANINELDSQLLTTNNNKIDNATNQGTGEGIFKDKTTTNLNFKSITAGVGISLTNNTNDINIASSGIGSTNTLEQSFYQVIRQSTNSQPSAVSFSSLGAMNIGWALGTTVFNAMELMRLPSAVPLYRLNPFRRLYWGIKLTGANWAGSDTLANLLMGFTTVDALSVSKNWITSDTIAGFDGVWNTATTAFDKAIYGRFSAGSGLWNYGAGNINVVSQTGLSTTVNQNDIIFATFNPDNSSFALIWLDSTTGYVSEQVSFITSPDGSILLGNFYHAEIVPIWSLQNRSAGWDIQIVNERECDTLGINLNRGTGLADGEHLFK